LKFSGSEKHIDSVIIAGLALVAYSNKILLHSLKFNRNGISTFLTRASDISVEMERGSARNIKKTQERKIIRRKRKGYLYFYGTS
jgi:hypothetical protein